ncbi:MULTISPECIES: minor capsid protein [unclassified Treponema]|uniref:minor capsid protein n=1 Tax=unclassified Treponema TaxID=2638727 RepID=UPI0020A270FF|nr:MULTISPECIES: minor capsid protein [unclassified Treponema]UTC66003.1 minor capsid protein [Treponema sp. OMZ 789]UTC68733.1 minor capsid protein [Treponema sp. OMZ 790]UTC71462.1 minor capsid protein [Treponema sp. OMZ 791]
MNKSGGIEFTVKGNFREAEAKARLNKAIKRVQMKLDTQVITDSNYFVPKNTTTLEKSAVINTVIGSGIIKWRTPYARRQYYGIDFDHSKQKNPNACAKWFEAAKARWLEKWRKLVNDEIQHS